MLIPDGMILPPQLAGEGKATLHNRLKELAAMGTGHSPSLKLTPKVPPESGGATREPFGLFSLVTLPAASCHHPRAYGR